MSQTGYITDHSGEGQACGADEGDPYGMVYPYEMYRSSALSIYVCNPCRWYRAEVKVKKVEYNCGVQADRRSSPQQPQTLRHRHSRDQPLELERY